MDKGRHLLQILYHSKTPTPSSCPELELLTLFGHPDDQKEALIKFSPVITIVLVSEVSYVLDVCLTHRFLLAYVIDDYEDAIRSSLHLPLEIV